MSDISQTASQLTSKVSEITESVGDLGRAAAKKLSIARNDTASALQTAASSVRTTGRETSDKIDNLTSGVANKLDATGSYIRKHDMKTIRANIRKFVNGRQTGFFMAAMGIGFLAGFAFRQRTHASRR